MKPITAILIAAFVALNVGCASDGAKNETPEESIYREKMRSFVMEIAQYARLVDPDFIVIPQNGHDLFTIGGDPSGDVASAYVLALSGAGQEDLFYGYQDDNAATPTEERNYLMELLDIAESNGVEALVTDYCWTPAYMDNSYAQNELQGYISFAAEDRELRTIPLYPAEPYNVNGNDITTLAEAKNFLYLLDPAGYFNFIGIDDSILRHKPVCAIAWFQSRRKGPD